MLLAPVEGIHTVKEGDTIDFGGTPIQVLHTPATPPVGDLPGGGRALLRGHPLRLLLRPDRLCGGSYGQILQSLKRLVSLEGNLRVCPRP